MEANEDSKSNDNGHSLEEGSTDTDYEETSSIYESVSDPEVIYEDEKVEPSKTTLLEENNSTDNNCLNISPIDLIDEDKILCNSSPKEDESTVKEECTNESSQEQVDTIEISEENNVPEKGNEEFHISFRNGYGRIFLDENEYIHDTLVKNSNSKETCKYLTDGVVKKDAETIVTGIKDSIKYVSEKSFDDIVIFVGNTGSGKSSLIQFLLDDKDKLKSVEKNGDFILQDAEGRIGSVTVTSCTFVPEIFFDKDAKMYYFDSPGFKDTRGPFMDFQNTYLVKKVIERAKKVKVVIVLNHSSVRSGIDRNDFTMVLEHVTQFVTDIKKYKNSIALVISKVENSYTRGQLVKDDEIKRNVANFMIEARMVFQKTADDNENAQKLIRLIDIILSNDDDFSKIGIFRRPDDVGPVNQMPIYRGSKRNIKDIIAKEIYYCPCNPNDFSFAVSDNTKLFILKLSEEISRTFTNDVENLMTNILVSFRKKETETNTNDFYSLLQTAHKDFEILVTHARRNNFVNQLQKSIVNLNVNWFDNDFFCILAKQELLQFLQTVGGQQEHPLEFFNLQGTILNHILKVETFIKKLKMWYSLLSEISEKLVTYEYFKKVRNVQFVVHDKAGADVVHTLFYVLKEIQFSTEFDALNFEQPTNSIINRIWIIMKQLSKYDVTNHANGRIEVKASNILVSELVRNGIFERKCDQLDIFASNTIFIDTGIRKAGLNLSIMAHTWEVIEQITINLDGEDGKNREELKAGSGRMSGLHGDDGLPGLPGHSGGSFFGIGTVYKNCQNLTIAAKGGNGGPGQDGGDGADGKDGETPTEMDFNKYTNKKKISKEERSFNGWAIFGYTKVRAEDNVDAVGTLGMEGGNGGNGGKGGNCGNSGLYRQIQLRGKSNTNTSVGKGQIGAGGKGGKGGRGGLSGKTVRVREVYDTYDWFFVKTDFRQHISTSTTPTSYSQDRAVDGRDGKDNENVSGQIHPQELPRHQYNKSLSSYRIFLRNELIVSRHNKQLESLLSMLNSSNVVKEYNSLNELVNELLALEGQYEKFGKYVDFRPLYMDLLRNVNQLDTAGTYSKKILLNYIQSMLISKMIALEDKRNNHLVVIDPLSYITLANEYMEDLMHEHDLKEVQKAVNQARDDYLGKLNQKIEELNDFFMTFLLVPNIKQHVVLIDDEISKLINQTENTLSNYSKEYEAQKISEQNLNKTLKWRIAFGFIGEVIQICWSIYRMLPNLNGTTNLMAVIDEAFKVTKSFPTEILKKKEILTKDLNEFDQSNTNNQTYDVIALANTSLNVYTKQKKDLQVNPSMKRSLDSIRNDIVQISMFREAIYKIVYPIYFHLQQVVNENVDNDINTSFISVIPKLKIVARLKEIKLVIQKTCKIFDKHEQLTLYIQRLIDTVSMMIDVFNRVEYYHERCELATYIANVVSPQSYLTEETKLLKDLKKSIAYNIALDYYKNATESFKQIMFPFTDHYLPEIKQEEMETTDVIELLQRNLKILKSKLVESKTTIRDHHDSFIRERSFSKELPFYVWPKDGNRENILKLLSGEEVYFSANITKSIKHFNAVKFKTIGIHFKCNNSEEQKALDAELRKFSVRMVHLGNSYYRCNNRYFLITSCKNTIEFSFAKKSEGKPLELNGTYSKLRNGNFMLSPYATWKIKLCRLLPGNDTNYENLERFAGRVDVELIGDGQYVSENFPPNANLIKQYYYEIEDPLDLNNVEVELLERGVIKLEDYQMKYLDNEDLIVEAVESAVETIADALPGEAVESAVETTEGTLQEYKNSITIKNFTATAKHTYNQLTNFFGNMITTGQPEVP